MTRLDASEQIIGGRVCLNGIVTTSTSAQVHQNNTVTLNGQKLIARAFRYLLMHKPARTICSNVDEHYPSIFNFLDIERASELHIAGRLDADTTGLLLLTDDGHWSYNITVPAKGCKKVYRVFLNRALDDSAILKFAEGIQLQGEARPTLPSRLEIVNKKEALLTITEGRFHQVKRMFAAVGNRVASLHREQIGAINLDVDEGHWRHLTENEVSSFSQPSEIVSRRILNQPLSRLVTGERRPTDD